MGSDKVTVTPTPTSVLIWLKESAPAGLEEASAEPLPCAEGPHGYRRMPRGNRCASSPCHPSPGPTLPAGPQQRSKAAPALAAIHHPCPPRTACFLQFKATLENVWEDLGPGEPIAQTPGPVRKFPKTWDQFFSEEISLISFFV